MAFKDLREFSQGRFIDLPIDGVTYRINDVDGETGLLVQRLMDAAFAAMQDGDAAELDLDEELLDDASEISSYERVLGDAYQQMLEDGVGWSDIKTAAMTTMLWIYTDEDTASKFWEAGGDLSKVEGKAPAPAANRASRRASSAAARKTRSRASTSGTRASRSTTARKAKAPGSRGGTSSPSGA